MPRWTERRAGPVVLSLNVRAAMPASTRVPGSFEVLARHLYDRMLHNEALGEDAASRAAQLLFAIALPGVLVALFLSPAYHQPIERARTYWSQAADHLFYVTYAMVVLGMALISQWEMLFPDLLDAYVLLSLPIRRAKLLLARVAALLAFLLLAHVGANGLGALFFPGAADLPVGFWRHLAAHGIAITMSGSAAVLALVALQALLVCVPARRWSESVSSLARAGAVMLLLTVLFLFPLTAHVLPTLLGGHARAAEAFPPFWFLGVYECVLYGGRALPVFHELARVALLSTLFFAVAAAMLYGPAHAIRLQRLIEGRALRGGGTRLWRSFFLRGLHLFVRTPGSRATYHFAAQTLWRLPRLQVSLAMYAGVSLALVLSELVAFTLRNGRVHLLIAESGLRAAVPVIAFLSVAGLRTAFAAPVGRHGAWLFAVTGARERPQEMRGGELLVTAVAVVATLGAVALLWLLPRESLHGARHLLALMVLATGLSVTLSDVLFLGVQTLPFTAARPAVTRELPLTLLQYFVVFPAFALYVADAEPWVAASAVHLGLTALGFAAAHAVARRVRPAMLRRGAAPEELIFAGLGLRD